MQASNSPYPAPALSLLVTEPLRAALDFCAGKFAAAPRPVGDGHPVIVYPGLGAGAITTAPLRKFLRESRFTPHDWALGVNTGPGGPFDDWLAELVGRVRALQHEHGTKVSLVGWSLGGVYAREVARVAPDAVRQVITLGTPFGSMAGANHAGRLYRLLGGDTSQLTPELEARLRTCPPVPTTSVYSRTDGVVAWQGCLQDEAPASENVEVDASHLGMATHPAVLRVVVDRLAQPEGRWQSFAAAPKRTLRRVARRSSQSTR